MDEWCENFGQVVYKIDTIGWRRKSLLGELGVTWALLEDF
jgi:hypothetical protein